MHYGSHLSIRSRSLSAALLLLAGTTQGIAADTFNLSTRQLSIPAIVIGTATYSNMVVTVKLPQVSGPTKTAATFLQDYYDPTTNQLLVSSVYLNGAPYHNVLVNLDPAGTFSFGGVTGADTYDGANLTIPAVQVLGGPVYANVIVSITAADIVSVSGNMPRVAQNQYDPVKGQLTIPVVEAAGRFYTNVVAGVTLKQVRSAGPAQLTDTVLYAFGGNGGAKDAAQPGAALIQGSDGNFYGTSFAGGANNTGAVFRVNPSSGAETLLYSFGASGGPDGTYPFAGLVQYPADGSLYGTTAAGGAHDLGAVFKVNPTTGAEAVLYSFAGGRTDGASPNGLMLATDGNFYGTTYLGGTSDAGIVFRLTPAGTATVLYSFGRLSANDGANPLAGLIEDAADGNLYGTTVAGGPYGSGSGTIFKVNPTTGAETVIYAFTGNGGVVLSTDGALPEAPLILANDGNFYGTTYSGGSYGAGAVFKVTPTGIESVVHSFGGDGASGSSGDGAYPLGSLTQDANGNFYGTTNAGGAFNQGTVFRVTPTGTETVLHSFSGDGAISGSSDGAFPGGGLLIGTNGSLFGTTFLGGADSQGAFYKLTGVVP